MGLVWSELNVAV